MQAVIECLYSMDGLARQNLTFERTEDAPSVRIGTKCQESPADYV